MGTPRSISGFEKAIAQAKEDLAELDVKLQNAEADSSEEEDLIAEKAEKGIELAQLEEQFEEFKAKEEEKANQEEEEKAENSGESTPEPEPESTPEPEEEKWPETLLLRARHDIGFMVNPFTHQRIETGFIQVVVDGWVKSQVKAGFLEKASQ